MRLPGVELLVCCRWFLFRKWRKHYRDRRVRLDGPAIHQRRLISPLQHGLNRRVHEIGRTGNISGAIDSAGLTDNYVKDNGTVNALVSNGGYRGETV